MGSFNQKCGISDMNIQWGESCYVIYLQKNKYHKLDDMPFENIFRPGDAFEMISFPQPVDYYDYGMFEKGKFTVDPINEIFDIKPYICGEESSSDHDRSYQNSRTPFMLIHKAVYEAMLVPPKSFQTSKWGNTKEIWEKGPSYFQEKYIKALSLDEEMFEILKHGELDEEKRAKIQEVMKGCAVGRQVQDILKNYSNGHFDPMAEKIVEAAVWPKNGDKPYTMLETDEFWKRFCDRFWFLFNMEGMNKFFIPSQYASQEDNVEFYPMLLKAQRQVMKEKKERYANDD